MTRPFRGVVERTYVLQGDRVLILESYEGDIEAGDKVLLERPTGDAEVTVKNVAWGSAYNAESPPLTLVVDPVDAAIAPGAKLRAQPA